MMATDCEWSRDAVKCLIEAYREETCLWDLSSPSYKNRVEKDVSWNKLVAHLKEDVPGIDSEKIKKKIHIIRTQFRNELNKFNNSKKSGICATSVYQPKLWCYERLRFLEDGMLKRSSMSSLDTIDINDSSLLEESRDESVNVMETFTAEDHEIMELKPDMFPFLPLPSSSTFQQPSTAESGDTSQAPTPSPSFAGSSKKSFKRKTPPESSEVEQQFLETIVSQLQSNDDHLKSWAVATANDLSKLKEDQQLIIKKMISELLLYGYLEKLKLDTHITGLKND